MPSNKPSTLDEELDSLISEIDIRGDGDGGGYIRDSEEVKEAIKQAIETYIIPPKVSQLLNPVVDTNNVTLKETVDIAARKGFDKAVDIARKALRGNKELR